MTEVIALGYIGVNTTDIDAWTALATSGLGLQATTTDSGTVRLRCDEKEYRIEVAPSDTEALSHIGLAVRNAAALHHLVAKLESFGYAVKPGDAELARSRAVSEVAVVDDPSGYRIELFYGQVSATDPFVSPTGARFITKGLGYGHVFISVADLAASEKFYVDALGFRVSDRSYDEDTGGDGLFLRCNPRHHTIGMAEVPGLPPTLFHTMFEVDDIDTVGYAYDRCVDGAAPITQTLGRHSNDKMLSFYIRTPSGFDIEYGTGGLQIPEDAWNAPEDRYRVESFWGHRRTPINARGAHKGWQY